MGSEMCIRDRYVGPRRLSIRDASDSDFHCATFVTFEFTTQKNAVRGEVMGLACSGHPLFCPVKATVRRMLHARDNNAAMTAPLARYKSGRRWTPLQPKHLSDTLKLAVTALGPANLGFTPADVSARSLRASGAMALLCAHVDTDMIRLIGRWRSDEMLRYLHVPAAPVMRDFSKPVSYTHLTLPTIYSV